MPVKVLKPFLLRRAKADVDKGLPPKKEIKLFVRMSGLQTDLYKSILKKESEVLTGANLSFCTIEYTQEYSNKEHV